MDRDMYIYNGCYPSSMKDLMPNFFAFLLGSVVELGYRDTFPVFSRLEGECW